MINKIVITEQDYTTAWSSKEGEYMLVLPVTVETISLLLNKINELVEQVNKLEEKLEFLDKSDI